METPEQPDRADVSEDRPDLTPPPPAPAPPPEPTEKVINVQCGNCKSMFEFKVEPRVKGAAFVCSNCGASNTFEEVE